MLKITPQSSVWWTYGSGRPSAWALSSVYCSRMNTHHHTPCAPSSAVLRCEAWLDVLLDMLTIFLHYRSWWSWMISVWRDILISGQLFKVRFFFSNVTWTMYFMNCMQYTAKSIMGTNFSCHETKAIGLWLQLLEGAHSFPLLGERRSYKVHRSH